MNTIKNRLRSLRAGFLLTLIAGALIALLMQCLVPETHAQLTLQRRDTTSVGDWTFTSLAVQPNNTDAPNKLAIQIKDGTGTNWFGISVTNAAPQFLFGGTNSVGISTNVNLGTGLTNNTAGKTLSIVNGVVVGVY